MKIKNSFFKVILKDGKPFVAHVFTHDNISEIADTMAVYGVSSAPYIKRMGMKMPLPEELKSELFALIK